MAIRITNTSTAGFRKRVEELSGVDLNLCFQCRKCSNGCPVARYADTPPSEIIRRLQFGAGREILDENMVWLCASCGTCHARCPMGIDIGAVMDALRVIAIEEQSKKTDGNQPLFNRAFLETVRIFGRSYDIGMIAAYKIGTMKLLQDTEKFPAMLKKGKIALLPSRSPGHKVVKRIFSKTAPKKPPAER